MYVYVYVSLSLSLSFYRSSVCKYMGMPHLRHLRLVSYSFFYIARVRRQSQAIGLPLGDSILELELGQLEECHVKKCKHVFLESPVLRYLRSNHYQLHAHGIGMVSSCRNRPELTRLLSNP